MAIVMLNCIADCVFAKTNREKPVIKRISPNTEVLFPNKNKRKFLFLRMVFFML